MDTSPDEHKSVCRAQTCTKSAGVVAPTNKIIIENELNVETADRGHFGITPERRGEGGGGGGRYRGTERGWKGRGKEREREREREGE